MKRWTTPTWAGLPGFVHDHILIRFSHHPAAGDTTQERLDKMQALTDLGCGYNDTPDTPELLEEAEAITSLVTGTGDGGPENSAMHRPVLDLDFPAELIPSTTPGHFHLYLDKQMEHGAYMRLLDALAAAGILEAGYVSASQARGYSAVRLPWVDKPATEDPITEWGLPE